MTSVVQTHDLDGNTYDVSANQLIWRPSVYGIIIKEDKILLTRFKGKYTLPGGGVELGESLEDALHREVKEETGISVGSVRLVDVASDFFSYKYLDGRIEHMQTLLMFYECRYESGEISSDGFDLEEQAYAEVATWTPLSSIEGIAKGSTYDWPEVVKKVQRT